MKLFDILADHTAILDLLSERDGELPDDEAASVVDSWFADIAAEEGKKLDSIVGVIRTLEAEATAAAAEYFRWKQRETTRTNAVKRIKDRVKLYLEMTGRRKVTTADGRPISICANGGKSPLTILPGTDPGTIEPSFQRVRVEINTDRVRECLENGVEIAFARLEPRGTHIRVG